MAAAGAPTAAAGQQAGAKSRVAANARNAFVRLVHAVPDAPPVDIYLGSRKVVTGLAYTKASRYLPLPPGTQTIRIARAGAGDALLEIPLTVEAGAAYTVAAAGTLKTLRPVVATDAFRPAGGKGGGSSLRVLHLAPDAPPVDVYSVGAKKGVGAETRLFQAAAYGKATAYSLVRAGSHTLEVRPSGNPLPVKEGIGAKLTPGRNMTAVAFGLLKGEDQQAFRVVLLPDDSAAK
jgi:hypothetical protein